MNANAPAFRVEVDLKKVGQWLRQAREDMNLSVREAAKLCGMSANQVTRMENGEDFTTGKLVQLAVPLGAPPAAVINGALTITPNSYSGRPAASIAALAELLPMTQAIKSKHPEARTLHLVELMDLIGVCACHLLLSANPQLSLQQLEIPLPSLRARFEQFINAYGLETSTAERAAVYRAINQHPARKLRALGLLTEDVIGESLERDKDENSNAHSQLTSDAVEGTDEEVPQNSDIWLRLVERVSKITSQRGDRARLARDLNVTRQAVSNWLSGASAPSAVVTLRLLEWVTAEEAKQK